MDTEEHKNEDVTINDKEEESFPPMETKEKDLLAKVWLLIST